MQMIDYTVLMKLGYEFYLNKRCGVVPAYAVEKVIGVQFEGEVR